MSALPGGPECGKPEGAVRFVTLASKTADLNPAAGGKDQRLAARSDRSGLPSLQQIQLGAKKLDVVASSGNLSLKRQATWGMLGDWCSANGNEMTQNRTRKTAIHVKLGRSLSQGSQLHE